ncbi:AGE family epimerase/isomerase [Defluviimonas aestuarii]|uniref:AGE family epimerase/isomerase n=1 Tax=Albidovulum aestuarii TaxID=1130726 RepID=UPI002499F04D|nr:AGE family epimerase/isomerase [Defluviimonas aestuarii]MDI3338013.1 AGE family epimerase/isomerase [Defluviimonas aestuarii]
MSSQHKAPRSDLPSCHHEFANDKPTDTRDTLDFDGRVDNPARYWWPVTEAIGAMAPLIKLDRRSEDEVWYHRLWIFANRHLIDHERGG